MANPKVPSLASTAEVLPGSVVLTVGASGRLAVVCTAAAIDLKLRNVAVTSAAEAIRRMAEIGPRVVIVPGMMDRSEKDAIAHAAKAVDAELVELPAIVQPHEATHRVAHAVATRASRAATRQRRRDP
ncbi:MAG: hypothetical protein JST00_09025 [Deltaproteobacteria bacterium]|nr:hypothetical protein [Deltaproteobacteria bacterium]